jgi:outer membrane lipoprotein-sorting protein
VALFGVGRAATPETPTDATPAAEHLRRAFANRYDLSATQRVRLIIRNGAGAERRRVVEIATKTIGGRLHSLGRFTEPDYLRGTAILIIENRDRNDDHFVYLPSQHRVRRVSSAQRADTFMGTDFIYEDFERRYVEDYSVVQRGTATIDGETVRLIAAKPRYDSAYRLAEFFIAESDFAILEVRYYQGPKEEPVKILRAPRSEMRIFEGHVLPTVMEMENRLRGTVSEARFDQITVNPTLEDTLFSISALGTERAIPIASPDPAAGPGG